MNTQENTSENSYRNVDSADKLEAGQEGRRDASANSSFTRLDLLSLARQFNATIWIAIAWTALGFTPVPIAWHPWEFALWMAVHTTSVVLAYQLSASLKVGKWLRTLIAVFPFLNLIVLSTLLAKAGRVLKERGILLTPTGVSREGMIRLEWEIAKCNPFPESEPDTKS